MALSKLVCGCGGRDRLALVRAGARGFVASAVVLVGLTAAGQARADVSSWLYLGVGGAALSGHGVSSPRVAMQLDTGVGTSPHRAVVLGVGARMMPYFGEATDFSIYARAATQGYVLGRLGAAIDLGAYSGTGDTRTSGYLATGNLGLPWGLVASGTYAMAGDGERAVTVTFGVDFLRLTVYRLAGEKQWPNVLPAYRPDPAPPAGAETP
jgi:hypothetical protein